MVYICGLGLAEPSGGRDGYAVGKDGSMFRYIERAMDIDREKGKDGKRLRDRDSDSDRERER